MFTIKTQPAGTFDIHAIEVASYHKRMTNQGYQLMAAWDRDGVNFGIELKAGDVAFIENSVGKTIDKVEGFDDGCAQNTPAANRI